MGSTREFSIGGKHGEVSGHPVRLEATVVGTISGYLHSFPQASGPPSLRDAGSVASLRAGGIDIVVSSKRCQCLSPSIFTDLGIELTDKQTIVVKSAQHFHGAFAPMAGDIIYMSGRGAVPTDPRLVPYHQLETSRLYPWVHDPLSVDKG